MALASATSISDPAFLFSVFCSLPRALTSALIRFEDYSSFVGMSARARHGLCQGECDTMYFTHDYSDLKDAQFSGKNLSSSPRRAHECIVRTFWYVLESLAAQAQDNCIGCVLLQLSRELSFNVVNPGTSGVSGYRSKTLPSSALKQSNFVMLLKLAGKRLNN